MNQDLQIVNSTPSNRMTVVRNCGKSLMSKTALFCKKCATVIPGLRAFKYSQDGICLFLRHGRLLLIERAQYLLISLRRIFQRMKNWQALLAAIKITRSHLAKIGCR